MNFTLPGHHFGGAQGCPNDAQGTQKGAKMMPREAKSQENEPRDTQRGTNEKKDDVVGDLDKHRIGMPSCTVVVV